MSTRAPLFDGFSGIQLNTDNQDVTVNYFMPGYIHYLELENPDIQPYGGINVGFGFVTNKSGFTNTKFAYGLKAGVLFQMNDYIAFKVQAEMLSMVSGIGGGLYDDLAGAGYGTRSYNTLWQPGFTGGIVVNFYPHIYSMRW
jgi:hypothetical protein